MQISVISTGDKVTGTTRTFTLDTFVIYIHNERKC